MVGNGDEVAVSGALNSDSDLDSDSDDWDSDSDSDDWDSEEDTDEWDSDEDEDEWDSDIDEEEMGEALYNVCDLEDEDKVSRLLVRGAPTEWRDGAGNTPLFMAAGGNLEAVKLLDSYGADIHVRNFFGMNALMEASLYGNLSVVEYLAGKGVSIHLRTKKEKLKTPYSQYTILKKQNALLIAALYGHIDVCIFLISKSANALKKDETKQSALTCEFGELSFHPLSLAEKAQFKKQLRSAWKSGPLMIRETRWRRRWNVMNFLTVSQVLPNGLRVKLYPMARDVLAAQLEQLQLDTLAPLDPIDRSTPESNYAYLLIQVFGQEGFVRIIVSFL